MKTVTKTLKTLRQAEKQQDKLYGKYEYVRLVKSPRFQESGVYAWQVSNETPPTNNN